MKCKKCTSFYCVPKLLAADLLVVSIIFVQTLDPFIQYDLINNANDSSEIIEDKNSVWLNCEQQQFLQSSDALFSECQIYLSVPKL